MTDKWGEIQIELLGSSIYLSSSYLGSTIVIRWAEISV